VPTIKFFTFLIIGEIRYQNYLEIIFLENLSKKKSFFEEKSKKENPLKKFFLEKKKLTISQSIFLVGKYYLRSNL